MSKSKTEVTFDNVVEGDRLLWTPPEWLVNESYPELKDVVVLEVMFEKETEYGGTQYLLVINEETTIDYLADPDELEFVE